MTDSITIIVPLAVQKGRIADLLISAFEGGSNYWYFIEEFIKPPVIEKWVDGSGAPADAIDVDSARVYPHGDYPLSPGGALIISVIDEAEAVATDPRYPKGPHRLDLDVITKGLALFAEKQPRHFGNWLAENDDAETADVFLQVCLFNGEIIFG